MLTLGKFSAWISTGGIALPEYGVKYSADGKEATCWIPSEENELFSIRWKESDVSLMDEYGQLQVVGYVAVDGTSCGGHFMSRSNGGVRAASKDSVNTSATTKRLLLFGKLQLTDDDQYLDRYATEEFGTIKLSLWKVEKLRRKFSIESPTVESHIIHKRVKKATLGHSVRYVPDIIPTGRPPGGRGSRKGFYEDSLTLVLVKDVLDAVRVKDGRKVVIKRMATGSEEHKIIAHLSSGSQLSDPRNRTVPVLDNITHTQDPSISFVVMPFARRFSHPPFSLSRGICQGNTAGLQFMHEQKISHFDIAVQNMVMDEPPVVPKGSHFARPSTHRGSFGLFSWRKRCSVGPLNYWYIDFGNSDLYPEGTEKARTLGLLRNCKEIQELSNTVPYNPFKVDVCQLGIVILEVIKPYPGLELFRALGDSMSNPHPDDRPDPTAALAQLDKIVQGLDPRTLRASIWRETDTWIDRLTRRFLGGSYLDFSPV
ncbi:hypothetical protein C8J57DRAFT_1706014 [Mycena rebaudengoi]|nr:hypothetical protein C8J57DRAFT_1706014 [Mycena rebaudengoi]